MAEQIKYFIDTSVNPNYPCNIYHKALYEWFVEENSLMKKPREITILHTRLISGHKSS